MVNREIYSIPLTREDSPRIPNISTENPGADYNDRAGSSSTIFTAIWFFPIESLIYCENSVVQCLHY